MKYTKQYLKDNKICINLKGNIEHLHLLEKMYNCDYSYFHTGFPEDEFISPQSNSHSTSPGWYENNGFTVWTIEQLLGDTNTEEWY